MERLFIPFTIAETKDAPAVAQVKFRIDRPQSQFRAAVISRMKFMRVYEQSKYEMLQYPFTDAWDRWKAYLDSQRSAISRAETVRNDLFFGHARSPELRAMDELPCIVEFELIRPSISSDRVIVNTNAQLEYQTINTTKNKFSNNDKTVQCHMTYLTDLTRGDYGGWEGSITCNMSNLGVFDIKNMSLGNEFELKVKMYNFKMEQMSTIPSMELNILFR